MKRFLLLFAFAAIGAFAVQMNDLAPDFDNTISDDGFWDTTGHQYVTVVEASSDASVFGSLESLGGSTDEGSTRSVFDSRETTQDESDDVFMFTSMPVGIRLIFR